MRLCERECMKESVRWKDRGVRERHRERARKREGGTDKERESAINKKSTKSAKTFLHLLETA